MSVGFLLSLRKNLLRKLQLYYYDKVVYDVHKCGDKYR